MCLHHLPGPRRPGSGSGPTIRSSTKGLTGVSRPRTTLKPVRRPPVYLAGFSPAAMRRVAHLADGWLPAVADTIKRAADQTTVRHVLVDLMDQADDIDRLLELILRRTGGGSLRLPQSGRTAAVTARFPVTADSTVEMM
jgi:hypothetical protein